MCQYVLKNTKGISKYTRINITYLFNRIPNIRKTSNVIPPRTATFWSGFCNITHSNWKKVMHCSQKIVLLETELFRFINRWLGWLQSANRRVNGPINQYFLNTRVLDLNTFATTNVTHFPSPMKETATEMTDSRYWYKNEKDTKELIRKKLFITLLSYIAYSMLLT